MSDEQEVMRVLMEYQRTHKMEYFEPYPKQTEFFNLGRTRNERTLFAGNQYGKSEAGAFETACHLTGNYPPDWKGRRFDHAVRAWAAGETAATVRNVQQRKLFGDPGVDGAIGTGFVPKEDIVGSPRMLRNVPDAYDSVTVRHRTNGVVDGMSVLGFKAYEQGRKKFASDTLDFVWWDEEPDEDIYVEGNARWTATGGMSFMTFTPLQGMSRVVKRFWENTSNELIGYVLMGPDDAAHITEEVIQSMLSKYPEYQWRARRDGLPMLGSGQIFTANEAWLRYDADEFAVPDHWQKLWGIDFGITHPFAAVFCMYDREADVFYVHHSFKAANTVPMMHADAILRYAGKFPVAWPHDGNKREMAGATIKSQYTTLGLRMMGEHATFSDGGMSTEAAILEMQERMRDGRFRVAAHLSDWWAEYRMYHRKLNEKTGRSEIVKLDDDLLSATMKAVMMKRNGAGGPIEPFLRRRLASSTSAMGDTSFDLFTGFPFGS